MGDYDSDEDESQYSKLRYANVPTSMFVSGWDDDNDSIEDDKNPEDSIERMILWTVNKNKINEIREILKLHPDVVNAVDSDGYTPLHQACYNNFIDVAKLLLEYKGNPNARTHFGWTPLHSACKWNNAECAQLLLQHGADLNSGSEGLQTPLHVSATVSNCRSTVTVLLLSHNINAQAVNNSEETAAEIARRSGLTYPVFEMGNTAYDYHTGLID